MGLGVSAVCRVLRVFSFVVFFVFFFLARVWFPLYTPCMFRGALCFLYVSLITYNKKGI